MILIDKNTANTVILELTASTTITAPYYVFSFVNDFTREQKVFTTLDLSNFICRYNRFEITEVPLADEDLLTGLVNLRPNGFWTYTVYESPTVTIDLTGLTAIQTGKVYVRGEDTETPSIYQ